MLPTTGRPSTSTKGAELNSTAAPAKVLFASSRATASAAYTARSRPGPMYRGGDRGYGRHEVGVILRVE